MPIRFKCPSCATLLQVSDASGGKRARCTSCQQVVPVPAAPTRPAAAATAGAPRPTAPPQARGSTTRNDGKIQIRCTQCARTLRLPATARGKTIRCPACQTSLKVPGGTATRPVAAPRPAPAPAAEPAWGGFDDLDLGSFSGAPAASTGPGGFSAASAASPYAPPRPMGGGYSPAVRRPRQDRHPALYIIPGVFILLWAILLLIGTFWRLGLIAWAIAQMGMGNVDMLRLGGFLAGSVLSIIVGVAMAIGAVNMIRRTALSTARTAAVLVTIPCFGLCIMMPFGIWALVLLYTDPAQRDFDS